MWVVCCEKKVRNIHAEDTASHVQKTKENTKRKPKKMEKNKEVPGFELTNFDCTKANTKREQKKKKRTKRCLVSNSRTLTA